MGNRESEKRSRRDKVMVTTGTLKMRQRSLTSGIGSLIQARKSWKNKAILLPFQTESFNGCLVNVTTEKSGRWRINPKASKISSLDGSFISICSIYSGR
jgi:hypothetical protein